MFAESAEKVGLGVASWLANGIAIQEDQCVKTIGIDEN
jgi:hypothetical protein